MSLFVPSDGYFTSKIDELIDTFERKFSRNENMDSLFSLKSVSASRAKNWTINIFGSSVTIVNFDTFYKFTNHFANIARGFFFPLLIFYNINQLYFLIRGVNLYGTTSDTK